MRTILEKKTDEDDKKVLDLLRKNLMQLNYQSLEYQYTVLMIACECGRHRVVKALIAKGAAINLQRTFGWSALHIAAMEGHLGCVMTLVAAGAELNQQNK